MPLCFIRIHQNDGLNALKAQGSEEFPVHSYVSRFFPLDCHLDAPQISEILLCCIEVRIQFIWGVTRIVYKKKPRIKES
jgi:hypothetical protein